MEDPTPFDRTGAPAGKVSSSDIPAQGPPQPLRSEGQGSDGFERAVEAGRAMLAARVPMDIAFPVGGDDDAMRAIVRAVLQALREPDRETANRGAFYCIQHAGPAGDHEIWQATRVWQAMIDRVLAGEGR
jgi:hypothetical protein